MQQAGISPLSFKQNQPLIGGSFLDILRSAASPLLDLETPFIAGVAPEVMHFLGPARKMLGVGGYQTGAGCGGGKRGYGAISGGKAYPTKAQLMQMM